MYCISESNIIILNVTSALENESQINPMSMRKVAADW